MSCYLNNGILYSHENEISALFSFIGIKFKHFVGRKMLAIKYIIPLI